MDEYIRLQVLITQGALYLKGGLPDPVPDPLSPNLQTVGKPKRAIERVLAAIGKPEILARRHLFAAYRLLVHHKLAGRSLAPLCIEYIGKPSFADISAKTCCVKEPSVQDPRPEPPLKRRKQVPSNTSTQPKHSSRDSAACSNAPIGAADYADPSEWRVLPFPFVGWRLPFDRFTFQSVTNGEEDAAHRHLYHTVTWMGRAAFPLLFDDDVQSSARSQAIASYVKFLLPNLEHPELTGSWSYDPKDWDSAYDAFALDRAPWPSCGPFACAATFLGDLYWGAPGITDLELALLDRPIGSCLVDERQNPPPKWKDDDKDDDNEVDGDGNEDAASDNVSVAGEYDHEEYIAPRALSTFDGVDLTAQFPALTRLSLCLPTESTNPGVQVAYVSVDCDIGILEEWVALIRATRGTLEQLILAEEIEMDSTGDAEFLAMFPCGPGYARFVEHCLPALLEENVQWPRLKSIRLYGFDVPPEVTEKYSSSQPQRLLIMVEARFKPMGVDVRSGLGRRMMYEDDDGVIRRGDGFGGSWIDLEEEEEEEEEFTPSSRGRPRCS